MLKLKLAIKAATVLFAFAFSLSPIEAIAQDKTKGDCSPIVKNITGNVSISCSIQGRTPVYKFSSNVWKDPQIVMPQLVNFIEKHEKEVFELDLWVNSDLKRPRRCDWQHREFNKWIKKNCKWTDYAYIHAKGNSLKGPGNILLDLYRDVDGPVSINVNGEAVYWKSGGIAIRGYFYVSGITANMGTLQYLLYEIGKDKLLGSGRYNLKN